MAAVAYSFDQVQHLGRLRDAQRGRRFIEHDQLRVEQQRARDGDRLALAPGERGDHIAHVRDARRELVQQRPGPDLHRDFVEPHRSEFTPEVDVRDDIEVLAQRQVLEHRRNAQIERRAGVAERDLLAPEGDGAGGRLVHAGQHLDQRRFACAVVADQRDHFAGVHVEVDVGQRRDGPEAFGDIAQAQDEFARRAPRGCGIIHRLGPLRGV